MKNIKVKFKCGRFPELVSGSFRMASFIIKDIKVKFKCGRLHELVSGSFKIVSFIIKELRTLRLNLNAGVFLNLFQDLLRC